MSLTRKIKDFDGVKPPQSFLIHPVTLRLIQEKKDDSIKINQKEFNDIKMFELPTINFSNDTILQSYNIKFINDLEQYLENNKENIRIIKIFFQENKNKILHLEKNDILNILEIISNKYNLTFDKTLNKLKEFLNSNKKWEDLFY